LIDIYVYYAYLTMLVPILLWHEILYRDGKREKNSSGKVDLAVTGWQKKGYFISAYC
jgi:hypothetical protein